MKSVNKVTLLGYTGKDPEVKTIEGGVKVAKVSLATTESYKDKSGVWKDVTEWHNLTMWRTLAESAEKNLKKGSRVYVEGKLQHRSWDDKDGTKRYATDVVVEGFIALDRKGESAGTVSAEHSMVSEPGAPGEPGENLPY